MIVDRNGNKVNDNEGQNNLLRQLYGTSLGRCALKVLISKPISVIGGLYMSSPLSILHISSFIKKNDIKMEEYQRKHFISYNDFFTRKIKPEYRPINQQENILIAPADSKLTYYPINDQTLLKIKDTVYTVGDLIDDERLSKEYKNGTCLIFRLTVDDYHRYSFIDDGNICANKYIPGQFHTVNPIANDYYPIYKRNCRELTVLKTDHFDQVLQIEVGAMMVGKIVNHSLQVYKKGQEKGYFKFGGSTIVLLFKENMIDVDQDIIKNSSQDNETRVLLGQRVGKKGMNNG